MMEYKQNRMYLVGGNRKIVRVQDNMPDDHICQLPSVLLRALLGLH